MPALRFTTIIGGAIAALGMAAALGAAAPALADEAGCTALNGKTLPPAALHLSNGGTKVTSTQYMAAAGRNPAFCKVLGEVTSVDPKAHPILWELNLPDAWNKKAVQYGGGGLNGTLTNGLAPLRDAPPTATPLALGYATFGTDAGHPDAKPDIQVFWANQEEAINHAYASYKKTHDVAASLIEAYYGQKTARMYFFGGSEGGREAMMEVQKYPGDYDGVVATVPAIHWIGGKLANNHDFRLVQAGGWMSAAKLQFLQKASVAVCDKQDGLEDGVISRYQGCPGIKPETLRCPGGADTGDTCLSDAQIALVKAIRSPFKYGYPLANGYTEFGALSTGGESQDAAVDPWILDKDKLPADDLGRSHYGPGAVRFLVTRDPNYRDDVDLVKYRERIEEASALMDYTNPDISAFQAHGGKLIMKENTADYTVSPTGVFQYYNDVVKTLGKAKTDSFLRLYVNPGVNHIGNGKLADGSEIPDRVDLLAALDNWVENGKAPGDLVVTSYDKTTPVASRPLCLYPTYPQYKGSGDPKMASSFSCKKS